MRFPQWNTQVYTQPMDTRHSAPQLAKPVRGMPKFHDTTGETIGLAILEVGGQILGAVAENQYKARQAEIARQVADAKVNANKELALYTQSLLHDPEYLTYGKRYNDKQDAMLKKYTKGMDPKAAEMFKTEFADLSTKYALTVQQEEITKHKGNVISSVEKELSSGIVNKNLKTIESALKRARDSGYFLDEQIQEMEKKAQYEYRKNVLKENMAEQGFGDSAETLSERAEDGSFAEFTWLREKDRIDLVKWATAKQDDIDARKEEEKNQSRDKVIGTLQGAYNEGSLTNGQLLNYQTLWEKEWGYLDSKTAKEFHRLQSYLKNDAEKRENVSEDITESLNSQTQHIVNLVKIGNIHPDLGEEMVLQLMEKHPGDMETRVFDNAIKTITSDEEYLPKPILEDVNKNFNATKNALGSHQEGARIVQELIDYKNSVEFDEKGMKTGDIVTEEELQEMANNKMMVFTQKQIAGQLGQEREFMEMREPPGLFAQKRKYDIGREDTVKYKDLIEEFTGEAATQTNMERLVELSGKMLDTKAYADLTDEQKAMVRENSRRMINTYEFWLRTDNAFWNENNVEKRQASIEWWKGTFPVFTTDKGQYILRYDKNTQSEYFSPVQVDKGTVESMGGYQYTTLNEFNPYTNRWEIIDE